MVVRAQYESAEARVAGVSTGTQARPHIRGKFLYAGDEKLYLRGVTYGTFRETQDGHFPAREIVDRDFRLMRAAGVNAVRTYTVAPEWLLDTAAEHELRVMAGVPWEQHVTFLDDRACVRSIRDHVRAAARDCARHQALLSYTIGNEIPGSIVRWHGRKRVQEFLRSLYDIVKSEDPEGLATYVNFPTTEYLELDFLDFASFNVYLETQDRLAAYLARLQSLAGDRPLVMAEVGLDSRRNGEIKQAEVLDWQIRTVFSSGCAGVFVFAWTDEWYRGGYDIEDWDFGLVTRDRRPKPALAAVQSAFEDSPFPRGAEWPRVSVVVCSYNGSRTIGETLEHITRLEYPNYEVIVVNDGSTDATPEIASAFNVRLITTANGGLSNARNVGMRAATGDIVAYCDDDAYPDPHWLHYVAHTYMTTDYAGVGGPNLPPPGDGWIAEAVANAPGGPIHVLLTDTEAEHIPGCNSSYRRRALLSVDGYDPTFRVAGDDVDLCWRIQQQGWKVGFHPAALVWHHRRNSLKAYWRQQRGYGKAEALLERKWPEKYNPAGHLTWRGHVYASGVLRALAPRSRVYQGTWGSAPFQRLYTLPPGIVQILAQMPEWYFITLLLVVAAAAGLSWTPLAAFAPLALLALALPLAQAVASARHASLPGARLTGARRACLVALTAGLFIVQPVARLWGRLRHGLTPWKRGGSRRAMPVPRVEKVWSEQWRSQEDWLATLERASAAIVVRGGDFDNWDLQFRGGLTGSARLKMAVEEHGAGRQLLRFRVWPMISRIALLVTIVAGSIAALAASQGAIAAAMMLALCAAAVAVWMVRDCSAAVGAAAAGVEELR